MASTKFKQYRDAVIGMARWGLTDKQMASAIGVSEQTINNWKRADEEFFESLKSAKAVADATVSDSLLKRATGFRYDEITRELIDNDLKVTKVVTKEQAPDTGAAMAWLKNRQPEYWRERREDHSDDGPNITIVNTLPQGD